MTDEQEEWDLERELRQLRRNISRRLGWRDYQVFPDRTLKLLAAEPPKSEAELLRVYGMGPRRVAQHGADILALCARSKEGQRPNET